MSSLGEVQRIIGLSLNKIQMGRNQRGGLPLHKNLLVATVLNKARDVYMQETMYMNYRLMACGQFNQEGAEDIEDEDTPEAEDYEEDSESDVEDDCESSLKKEYVSQSGIQGLATTSTAEDDLSPEHPSVEEHASTLEPVPVKNSNESATTSNSDEGFIDESDCDCDTRNFCQDSESRVPFQYCFNCAPFHPSNGRGPTLVGPQTSPGCMLSQPVTQEQEDKLIYDMDSKSTRNQSSSQSPIKRKRHISEEETQDAIVSILPKKKRSEEEGDDLNDSGFQEESEIFHPAFRGHTGGSGMEVEQITSLVSIFSFGQQLFNNPDSLQPKQSIASQKGKDDEDSDSDSDTSSDSGHSSDDHETNTDDKNDEASEEIGMPEIDNRLCGNADFRCASQVKDSDLDVTTVSVTTTV